MTDTNTHSDTRTVGAVGEDAVAAWYEAHGYRIVGRNVHEGHLELDIIAEDDTGLAFIEVKARTQSTAQPSRFGRPADAVNHGKRRRTVAAAQAYLRTHPTTKQPRIDIAEVYLCKSTDGTPSVREVRVFRNAVQAK